jgi:hypothetical protein
LAAVVKERVSFSTRKYCDLQSGCHLTSSATLTRRTHSATAHPNVCSSLHLMMNTMLLSKLHSSKLLSYPAACTRSVQSSPTHQRHLMFSQTIVQAPHRAAKVCMLPVFSNKAACFTTSAVLHVPAVHLLTSPTSSWSQGYHQARLYCLCRLEVAIQLLLRCRCAHCSIRGTSFRRRWRMMMRSCLQTLLLTAWPWCDLLPVALMARAAAMHMRTPVFHACPC